MGHKNGCKGALGVRNVNGKKTCATYSYVTKNPFDVGIAKALGGDEYLVLLSGNHHKSSDYDKDKLPDWIAMGERPCREYKTVETDELVQMWHMDYHPKEDPCLHKRSFDVCHPNGFINYYLSNGTNRSQVVEILEANVDTTQEDPTFVLKVKVLEKGDDRLELDGLFPRMFRVSLVVDSRKDDKRKENHTDRKTVIAYPPATGPVEFGSQAVVTGAQELSGPVTTTTTTTQDTTQQQLAQQQQQMGKFGDDKGKKNKKDKKDKCKKCHKMKNKQQKKKCLKKCKKGGGGGGGRYYENERSYEKKKSS